MMKSVGLAITTLFVFGCALVSGVVDSPAGRQEIVRRINAGELPIADDSVTVRLPGEFAALSNSGEVMVLGEGPARSIIFFIERGILGAYRGYIWEGDCELTSDPLGGDLVGSTSLGECWFRVSAN